MLTALSLLFTLSAIGISETAYLIRARRAGQKPICPMAESCLIVLESKYNRLFLVRNDLLGLIFYIGVAIIISLVLLEIQPRLFWVTIMKTAIVGGALVSVLLLYLQWRVIKAWCFWCILSALTMFGMLLIILLSPTWSNNYP